MDFSLRCNEPKCRKQIHDEAVVTTCSHAFCTQCADTTGLSRLPKEERICPSCKTQLINSSDAIVALLNPSEDYKTSVLSGLSPAIIMECATRGLAFHSYQASQEVHYQAHVTKTLTEKYEKLSQQMDQLIDDANVQIQVLQEKMQAMEGEQSSLERQNKELVEAFRDKSKAHQQTHQLYQSLKAQVMATQVANDAQEGVNYALEATRPGDRFIDKLPGTRSGTANVGQPDANRPRSAGRSHNYIDGRSSGSSGERGADGGVRFNSQIQTHVFGGATSGRSPPNVSPPNNPAPNNSPPGRTPPGQSRTYRSQLPVMGGVRPNPVPIIDVGPSYQASPLTRQPVGGNFSPMNMNIRRSGEKPRRTGMGNSGILGR